MSEKNTPAELPGWIADHVKLYLNDPDKAHMWDSAPVGGPGLLPTLLLTTTGRKSGKPRILPLLYVKVDAGFVIIASKGGAPQHPGWFLNLLDEPKCEIRVGRDYDRVAARVAEGEEREELRVGETHRRSLLAAATRRGRLRSGSGASSGDPWARLWASRTG